MIPYGHQSIDKKDIEAVIKVLKSDWLTQGPKVFEFEKVLAKYCGVKYAVVICNGTAALHLAYLTAGLKPGDEVITSPNTFAATTNMLLNLGVKPVFCDIRPDTYNIDEAKIEKLINKKTKAIVPVHFAGQPCEMDKIKRIARKHKLLVIEDACHALGAKYQGIKIGSCRYADMVVFSFHAVKSITTGEGGAILTNNKKYYEKLILLRNHGIYKDKSGKNIMVALGYNYRMTDMQAALGISQFKKLESFVKKRHQVATWYKQELKNVKQIILPLELKGNFSSWHIYVIRVASANDRDKLAAYLKSKGIGVNFHYPAVYSHVFYKRYGYDGIKLNHEENYCSYSITLPCFPDLGADQVKYVCDKVKDYYANKKIFENYKNSSTVIAGERIYLKIMQTKNATLGYCNWLNDPEVNKYLKTRHSSIKQLKEFVQKQINNPNSLFYGIFDKKNNKHIGNVKLEPINWKKKKCFFGMLIGNKNYWGKGFGTEVARLIVEYAFHRLGLNEIELAVAANNKRAVRVYEKVGFKVKEIKKELNRDGILSDGVTMAIKNK